MKSRILGRTGLKVSEIGFGAWAIGGNAHGNSYGPTDDAESVAAVRRAIELGVNFVDTADVYGWGHSEEILGEALQNRRDDVHIATKVGGDFYHGGVRMNFDPGYIAFALERSLKRLRTDHVDVYQLHNPPAEMIGNPETHDGPGGVAVCARFPRGLRDDSGCQDRRPGRGERRRERRATALERRRRAGAPPLCEGLRNVRRATGSVTSRVTESPRSATPLRSAPPVRLFLLGAGRRGDSPHHRGGHRA